MEAEPENRTGMRAEEEETNQGNTAKIRENNERHFPIRSKFTPNVSG